MMKFLPQHWLDHAGFWQLLSIVALVTMAAGVKFLGQQHDVQEIVYYRAWIGLTLLMPLFGTYLARGERVWSVVRRDIIILRAFFNIVALLCGFYAVIHIPLSVSATLSFSRTFYVIALGAIFLQDKAHRQHWLTAAVGFFGILILLRPGMGDFTLELGMLFSLLSAFFLACGAITTRFISQRETPFRILFWTAFYVALFSLPLIHWNVGDLHAESVILMLGITLAGLCGQFCNILSLKRASAASMVSYSYLRVLFASLYGYLLFDTVPDGWTIVGAGIIIAANIYAARHGSGPDRRGLNVGV